MGKNGYFDIIVLSGRLYNSLAQRLGHMNINTKIVAFQTYIKGGSCLIFNIYFLAIRTCVQKLEIQTCMMMGNTKW
jgi:hypothetical protein